MKKKSIFALLLTVIMMFGSVLPTSAAMPSISTNRYLRTYPLSTKNNTYVYKDSNLRTRGTSSPNRKYNAVIYATDEIYVYSINGSSAYVSYPSSTGRKYGYINTSAITSNNYSQGCIQSRAKITTYKRAGSGSYGSIAKGDSVYTVAKNGNYVQVVYPVGRQYKMGWITLNSYNSYIKKQTVTYTPQGCFDSVASTVDNTITVRGWAFDRDNVNSKLKIHVYVGGPAGSGAPCYVITAMKLRTDVNRAYPGVGNYHGFSAVINVDTNKVGNQPIYVYAINVGGGNSNPLIGTRMVNIKGKVKSSALLFPLKGSITRSSNKQTNGYYCDYKTGGSVPVYAPTDGTVVFKQAYRGKENKALSSYGNYIEFTSSDGVYKVKCCHMSSFYGVETVIKNSLSYPCSGSDDQLPLGTKQVKQGELLGYTGFTGNASGHHLHLEVYKNGVAVNPTNVFTTW